MPKTLSPEHKAKLLAGKAASKLKKQQALLAEAETEDPGLLADDDEVLAPASNPGGPASEYAEVADLLDQLPEGQLADLHALALQVIKDALCGLKVLVQTTDGKTPQLLKGTAALWKADTPEGGRYVYGYKPDIKLAQFVAQHAEGKPGQKEMTAKATMVLFQSTLPGQDAAINSYLSSLPDEVLQKFGYDEATLESIKGS